jgi:YfiH family protein
MIKDEILARSSDVAHGFFTREGGVSGGIYASLNCGLGSGDDKATVRENRRRALDRMSLGGDRLRTVHQVHGKAVWSIDVETSVAPKEADGVVTKLRGVALGILTADCAPVLFADAEAGVIGAAHAGWKGALIGVLEATVAAMEALGARRKAVGAVVGPCIAWASYEVGPEFPRPFLDEDAANRAYFQPSPRAGHFQFDLAGYVAAKLERLGLGEVAAVGVDTYSDEGRFFSYRRTCHRREPDYGRQISMIALSS